MRIVRAENQKIFDTYFGIYLIIVSLLRLFLVHDIELPMVNSPHDGSLYVSRAYYLVTAGNFGPYDGRLFVKDPGSSLFIAISRWLGFDYLSFLNLLHIIAAVYFATGLVRIGLGRVKSGILFAVALFAPLTVSTTWFNVLRENLDIILHLFFFAALTFGLASWRQNKTSPLDMFVLSISGAALFYLREESVLLLAVIAGLFAIEMLRWWRAHRVIALSPAKNGTMRACALMLLTIALFKIGFMSIYFLKYDTFVVNDFGSGSFPRFVAALRSASGDAQRPYVSITQDGLHKVAKQVPYLQRLVDHMPGLPGPNDPYANRYGVFDEFTNSHIMFWIKDAAFGAGFTPNASEAQKFFSTAANDIEAACARGALTCVSEPSTLIPPVKLAWLKNIRFGIWDGLHNLVHLASSHCRPSACIAFSNTEGLDAMDDIQPFVIGQLAGWSEAIRLGRMHQFAAKIAVDSLGQTAAFYRSQKLSVEDLSVDYWCRYQDIAVEKYFGVLNSLTPEFYRQFSQALGIDGGVTDSATLADPKYSAPLVKFASANAPTDCWKSDAFPVVGASLYFLRQQRGPISGLLKSPSGAYRHFIEWGDQEGRLFFDPVSFNTEMARAVGNSVTQYSPRTVRVRHFIVDKLWDINPCIFALGAIAFLYTFLNPRKNPLSWPMGLILFYGAIKITALGYIAITMGLLEHRMYASLNYILMLFTLTYVACVWFVREDGYKLSQCAGETGKE
jgi:hypothetical protein